MSPPKNNWGIIRMGTAIKANCSVLAIAETNKLRQEPAIEVDTRINQNWKNLAAPGD